MHSCKPLFNLICKSKIKTVIKLKCFQTKIHLKPNSLTKHILDPTVAFYSYIQTHAPPKIIGTYKKWNLNTKTKIYFKRYESKSLWVELQPSHVEKSKNAMEKSGLMTLMYGVIFIKIQPCLAHLNKKKIIISKN